MCATEDWETTCLIYEDAKTTTLLNADGQLSRGSIRLKVSIADCVCCQKVQPFDPQEPSYRFWTVSSEKDLEFLVVFWGDEGKYQRLDISLQSHYPSTFPPKQGWLDWLHTKTSETLTEEEVSFSVCMFVKNQALAYFTSLFRSDDCNLICFDNTISLGDTLTIAAEYSNGIMVVTDDQNKVDSDEADRIYSAIKLSKEWLRVQCPICFDFPGHGEATTISCGHTFCRTCLSTYLRFKAQEINAHKVNPFTCPMPKCQRGMLIVGCVKQYLPEQLMDEVRTWYKDMKNPPCYSLPQCVKLGCSGKIRRKAIDSYIVFCDSCNGSWCELCLRGVSRDIHKDKDCQVARCVRFCERYLAATDDQKKKCEEKRPWIRIYAKSRVHDASVVNWIESNGQVCPGCKTGIERSIGCFHMKCQWGTHFCYECGEEIFPPYYGTHHCWEAAMW